VTPRSTEELVLDVIFQVRMDVNKCPGGKLQVRFFLFIVAMAINFCDVPSFSITHRSFSWPHRC